jgi:hypothetical protein
LTSLGRQVKLVAAAAKCCGNRMTGRPTTPLAAGMSLVIPTVRAIAACFPLGVCRAMLGGAIAGLPALSRFRSQQDVEWD